MVVGHVELIFFLLNVNGIKKAQVMQILTEILNLSPYNMKSRILFKKKIKITSNVTCVI